MMPKSKVAILTSASSALEPRMFHREAQSLRQAGYEVTVVAPLDENGSLLDTGGKNNCHCWREWLQLGERASGNWAAQAGES